MTASHCITSHDMTGHHITSLHMTWRDTTSCHISWHDITSHHVTWHDVTPRQVTPHDIHDMTGQDMTPHHVTRHHIIWHGTKSHHSTAHDTTTSPHLAANELTSHHITHHHSLLASIAVGVGQASGVVPENLWFFPFPCYWVYLLVLCFRQRIRGVCRHRMVFMDKLCIHQTDDKMKEAGILGLGAFVQKSDKLLVLWSQRYFNRLQLISVKSGLSFCSTDISLWSACLPPPGCKTVAFNS